MDSSNSIVISNIYYMLTYAFQVLRQSNYEEVASEPFDNIQDLFAAILSKGIAQQLKQGLHREYIERTEDLSVMHGRIDINGTIRNLAQDRKLLSCEYDELSESDIMLTRGDKTLIIDAKYYSHATQVQYGKHTLHSQNVYQIFTYVMNQDVGNTGNVAGLLLYAKTDEDIVPDVDTVIMGHKISAKALDLNCDFSVISKQLKYIAQGSWNRCAGLHFPFFRL